MKLINFIKNSIMQLKMHKYYNALLNNNIQDVERDILFGNVNGTDLY